MNKTRLHDRQKIGSLSIEGTQMIYPADTGRKLNVHKTFRRCAVLLLNVLFTFYLRLVFVEMLKVGSHLEIRRDKER